MSPSSMARGLPAEKAEPKQHGPFVDMVIRLVKEKPLGLIGGIIVLGLFLIGILANVIAPYGYNEMMLGERLSAPSATHILGTDNMGRDMLSRIIFGARISMIVGLAGAAISAVVGFIVGGISGYFGGKFDMFFQRFVDAVMCFPSLILYLTIMAIIGQGLVPVIVVLGVTTGFMASRTIRSAVIGIKQNMYIQAAEASGTRTKNIILRHVLPNIMPVIIVGFTLTVGSMVLSEAMLSFLGYGVPPPTPTWGSMLQGSARRYMLQAPWMALWPGVALALAVYGINMFGDALRDLWDPRLRGGLGRYGKVKIKKR
ncbi:MAG: ABC transporter permease [Dehalococcoidales bacterium]|nr:ABC transporter permease [Dehalococcoidales bacterium]